jgi:hypothetical protein
MKEAGQPPKGPWHATNDGRWINSAWFDLDASLKVDGDFPDEAARIVFAQSIARVLNAAEALAATAVEEGQPEQPLGVPASPSGSPLQAALSAAIPNAEALKADALAIFNDLPAETPQVVRDVIEWYDASLRVALARGMEARSGETEGLDPEGATARPAGTRPEGVPAAAQGEALTKARELLREFIDLCQVGDVDENTDALGWGDLILSAKSFLASPVEAPQAEPDWCAAGPDVCNYGPHGPHGERQCKFCGSPPPEPAAQPDPDVPDIIAGALQTSRAHAWELMRAAVAAEDGEQAAQPAVGALTPEQSAAYDKVDHILRSALMDKDYAEYSAALDSLTTPPAQAEQSALTTAMLIDAHYAANKTGALAGTPIWAAAMRAALTRKDLP